ncbi:radical SAM/SPASM domain-containing protein [Aliikangiella coralliicola]|uniref:Radical SAM protein n=1 Tax=Aliikangiella coralliicola TaxID=2592383 RepID=A0A545UE07_9GAMM|nr:radical SAM protein [Aliikangiella coralliicola]TQV87691.1 radical SAM protein [Aliikangiella coralliicola]
MLKSVWSNLIFFNKSKSFQSPHLQWHLTDKCNLRCTHCYQDSYCDNGLNYDEMLEVLEQFRCLLLHFRERNGSKIKGHITLTGGEPLVKKGFYPLLEKIAADSDLYTFAILTNGTLIDDKKAKWLSGLKPRYVQVSLDGSESVHDEIRGLGNFHKTKRAISILKSNDIRVMVSFTATKRNFRTFPQVADACREVNADFLWSDRLIPEGSAEKNREVIMTKEETSYFFRIMKAEADKCHQDKTTKTRVKMHRALQFQFSNSTPYRCVAGETLLTVMPNGDLYPCRRMPVKVGNVLETPLASLYYNAPLLRSLRDSKKVSQGCEKCDSNQDCRGGLKCLSYAVYGNAHVKDPGCEVNSEQALKITSL